MVGLGWQGPDLFELVFLLWLKIPKSEINLYSWSQLVSSKTLLVMRTIEV